jgi:hypothetical protein
MVYAASSQTREPAGVHEDLADGPRSGRLRLLKGEEGKVPVSSPVGVIVLALLASVILGGLLGRLWEQRDRRDAEKKWRERDRLLDRRDAGAHDSEPVRGGNIKLTLRVTLTQAQAGQLTARAIREGKRLDTLAGEILEAAPTAPTS